MVVEADFSMAKRPRQEDVTAFYDAIYQKLKDLDIAILINNAGVMYTGRFDEFGPEATRWKEMLDINILHVAMMTMYFKDKLIARQAQSGGAIRSALINVSSAMGYLKGSKGAAVYSSSKGFVTYFTAALGWELRNQLDVQCLTPNLTRTSLLADITRKAGVLEAISPLDCARGSLGT